MLSQSMCSVSPSQMHAAETPHVLPLKGKLVELSKLDKRLVPGEIHHFNLNMICQETGQVKCVLKDSV